MGAPRTCRRFRSLEIRNVFLQADGVSRDASLRDPQEWESKNTHRNRELGAPAYGFNDAPAAVHRSSQQNLVNSDDSPAKEGPRFEASSFDPRRYSAFGQAGREVWPITTHIDDILCCGEPGATS